MAKTYQEFLKIRDNFIKTKADMKQYLSGYNIVSRIIIDKDILNYAKHNEIIGKQYGNTILTSHILEDDFLRGIHDVEYLYDEQTKQEYKITHYDLYRRNDKLCIHDMTPSNLYKNVLLSLTNDNELKEFIHNIDTTMLYMQNQVFAGRINRQLFDEHFAEYKHVMYKNGEHSNHFGTRYNPNNNLLCNNIEYYVNLVKLYKYVKKCSKMIEPK